MTSLSNRRIYVLDEYLKLVGGKDFDYRKINQKEDQPDQVYLIHNPENNLYKIGITANMKNRFRHLVSQSGCDLNLLLVLKLQHECDESAKFIERFCHDFFKDKRVRGEWFNLDKRDIVSLYGMFWFIEGEDIKDYIRVYNF